MKPKLAHGEKLKIKESLETISITDPHGVLQFLVEHDDCSYTAWSEGKRWQINCNDCPFGDPENGIAHKCYELDSIKPNAQILLQKFQIKDLLNDI
jgi:hypothetical protein